MASHPRTSAREERRLDIRRLVIASLASALAAVIVSQFSVAGTWIAAALTPVFVILIQEALHKPTDVIAERFTSNRTAVLPEGTGGGPPPPAGELRARREEALPRRAQAEPGSEPGRAEPPVRVYRSGAGGGQVRPRAARRRIAIGSIVVTALLAFTIAAFAITGTELVTGGSIGKSDKHTTLFGGAKNTSTTQDQGTTAPQQAPQQQQTAPKAAPPAGTKQQGSQPGKQQTTPAQPGAGGQAVPAPQTTSP
jgi:hypothetical protein